MCKDVGRRKKDFPSFKEKLQTQADYNDHHLKYIEEEEAKKPLKLQTLEDEEAGR